MYSPISAWWKTTIFIGSAFLISLVFFAFSAFTNVEKHQKAFFSWQKIDGVNFVNFCEVISTQWQTHSCYSKSKWDIIHRVNNNALVLVCILCYSSES